jgi:hypothetical protein
VVEMNDDVKYKGEPERLKALDSSILPEASLILLSKSGKRRKMEFGRIPLP